MRIIGSSPKALLALVAAAALCASAHAKNAPSKVVVLGSQKDFDQFIASNSVALVEFFAPWCGHCKNLAPEYEKAAGLLEETGVRLASVDCVGEESGKVCEKYNVKGYPTMKIFKDGTESEYDGPRESEGMTKYMKKYLSQAGLYLASN